jgi:hypothetical protein
MYYTGLDVHKKTISFCVKDAAGRVHQEGKVGSTRRELDSWIRNLPQPRTIAMEATIFTGWIYDHLLPHAEKVKVAHPLMLRAICVGGAAPLLMERLRVWTPTSFGMKIDIWRSLSTCQKDLRYARQPIPRYSRTPSTPSSWPIPLSSNLLFFTTKEWSIGVWIPRTRKNQRSSPESIVK